MGFSEILKRLFVAHMNHTREESEEFNNAQSEREDVDPFEPFPEPVRLEITDVFDLHSIPPRDVRAVVEEYLLEARRLGFRQVRIIHGKGVGVQREIVRAILARTDFVERFADAPAEAGGWGATVAFISPTSRVSIYSPSKTS